MDFSYQIVSIQDFLEEPDGEIIFQKIVGNFDSINADRLNRSISNKWRKVVLQRTLLWNMQIQ